MGDSGLRKWIELDNIGDFHSAYCRICGKLAFYCHIDNAEEDSEESIRQETIREILVYLTKLVDENRWFMCVDCMNKRLEYIKK